MKPERPQHSDKASFLWAEVDRLVKHEEETSKAKRMRGNLPRDLLNELVNASRNYAPDQIELAQAFHKPLTPPVAACKLSILSEGEGGKECAILAIQVCTTDLTLAGQSSEQCDCYYYISRSHWCCAD